MKTAKCRCGRALTVAKGDIDATCDECRNTADSCPCGLLGAELITGAHNGAWLTVQEFPPLAYAIQGLIPEGLTLEVGPPKAGKSWLTLGLLLAVASGGVALGGIKASPPRTVCYFALEDGDRRMQDRCRALLGNERIPRLFNYITEIQPGTILQTIAAWMTAYPDTAMIVVDTLGKVMPPAMPGESAYQRDYRVGAALKREADAHQGLAIVVLHHDRKAGSDDFVDSVSGTHGLAGAADTVVVLCRKRQSPDGSVKITGRDVPESEYALKVINGMVWQLDGADLIAAAATAARRDETNALGDVSAHVLAAVQRRPEGVRANDLVPQFGKEVYQYLKRLTEAGRIDKVARGLYVPAASDTRPDTPLSEVSEVSDSQVTAFSASDRVLTPTRVVSVVRGKFGSVSETESVDDLGGDLLGDDLDPEVSDTSDTLSETTTPPLSRQSDTSDTTDTDDRWPAGTGGEAAQL